MLQGNQSCIITFVEDLEVVMSIGICDHERAAGFKQRVLVSVKLFRNQARLQAQNIEDCLNYAELHDYIAAWADRDHVDLLETLAEELVEKSLSDPRIDACWVRVAKPDIFEDSNAVGVEFYTKREDYHDR